MSITFFFWVRNPFSSQGAIYLYTAYTLTSVVYSIATASWNAASGVPGGAGCTAGGAGDAGAAGARRLSASARRPAAAGQLWLSASTRLLSKSDSVGQEAGDEGNTGGGIPDGTDGWSARMMWRTEGAVVQYVYHPDQPQHYGEDLPWSVADEPLHFAPGQWHEVVHEIRMNTPGLNDGSITAWFDGVLALEADAMRFRDVDSFAIDGMYFSTFFGGGSSSWSTTADEVVLFDDFRIERVIP